MKSGNGCFLARSDSIISGELSDRATVILRDVIKKKFSFDPDKDVTRDAIEALCHQNIVDPVCDYLSGLLWDGTSRIDKWLVDCTGAGNTPYVRAVGAIMLIWLDRARSDHIALW